MADGMTTAATLTGSFRKTAPTRAEPVVLEINEGPIERIGDAMADQAELPAVPMQRCRIGGHRACDPNEPQKFTESPPLR